MINSTSTYGNTRQLQMNKFFSVALMVTICAFLLMVPELAFANGLARAQSGMEKFQTAILPVLRVGCVIAFILAGAGYMAGFLDKSWFVKAVAGIIIIGSANEIVGLIW